MKNIHKVHKFLLWHQVVIWENTSKSFTKFKKITNVILVENYLLKQIQWTSTLTLPGSFGMASLKMGWMGKMAEQIQSPSDILEQN